MQNVFFFSSKSLEEGIVFVDLTFTERVRKQQIRLSLCPCVALVEPDNRGVSEIFRNKPFYNNHLYKMEDIKRIYLRVSGTSQSSLQSRRDVHKHSYKIQKLFFFKFGLFCLA